MGFHEVLALLVGHVPCHKLSSRRTNLQGREHEWMFASEEGQAQVAASCRSRRAILVSMRRGQQYGDISALKACCRTPADARPGSRLMLRRRLCSHVCYALHPVSRPTCVLSSADLPWSSSLDAS